MVKKLLFQLHWLAGITAGIVLIVTGLTGALLSFEDELQQVFNPATFQVTPHGPRLSPDQILATLAARGERPASLMLERDAQAPATVTLMPAAGERRGKTRYLDPYTANWLPEPSGKAFFRTVMGLHRWLLADEIGKQIVGASTVALLMLCLSGLYLRWPRQWRSLRTWLVVEKQHRGRSFLWSLHSVAGTWVLACLLLAGLTGLTWSYESYRSLLQSWSGVPKGEKREGPRPLQADAPLPVLDRAFGVFGEQASHWQRVVIRLPAAAGKPVEFRYITDLSAHERASDRMMISADGAIVKTERWQDKNTGAQLFGSIYVLHTGSYFGLTGRILMLLASLSLPLFTVTGWMMYLDRRRSKTRARKARRQLAATGRPDGAPWLVAYASQTGNAEELAWQTAGVLQGAGIATEVLALGKLGDRLAHYRHALFIVSTHGSGEAPDNAAGFVRTLHDHHDLSALEFAVLALGDSGYAQFCQFGHDLAAGLQRQGARALFDLIERDGDDPAAVEQWFARLAHWTGHASPVLPAVEFSTWRLTEREQLNPDSDAPTYHVVLRPEGPLPEWQSGDIARIRAGTGDTAPLRDYSIASVSADGALHLLIRQVRKADGTLGTGSGWLTHELPLDGTVQLRLRSNRAFRLPADDRPIILIGNGTGLSSLRAHLRERALRGQNRNWLIFGERHRQNDYYYRDELVQWHAEGHLARLDTAFSRDQANKVYVQDVLQQQAVELRDWLAQGASLYVCGSLEGMARGVESTLTTLLGREQLEQLTREGRYCRDVY